MNKKIQYTEETDLRGVPCPANAARIILKLESMDEGKILKTLIDEGEAYENLLSSLDEDGYELITSAKKVGGWEVFIKA